jgi:hypothetical protein
MTKEEETYYNNYFSLFQSAGWAQLVEDLQDRFDAYEIGYLKDAKDLYTVQGELSIIRMILNLEDFIEQGYKSANESN